MALERVVILGGPKTGKTTLALEMQAQGRVRHTDDLMRLEWSASSQLASEWFDLPYGVIEGVAAVRALRKWLKRNATGKPCDRIIYLTRFHERPTDGQKAMTKAISTIFAGIYDDLVSRGVEVEVRR